MFRKVIKNKNTIRITNQAESVRSPSSVLRAPLRIHLLALPNVQTTAAYALDGFCTATIRFAKLLKGLGHTVFLYASEENEAPCDELVTVISKEEQTTLLDGCPYQYAAGENKHPLWTLANGRMVTEIRARAQARDLICLIGGTSQQPVAAALPELMTVEYSIGYVASFANYRVYESHAWRHCTHGFQQRMDGAFFDAVIPYFFEVEPPPRLTGALARQGAEEPFALYVGRLTARKGIGIACAAAAAAGMRLKVIGHGDVGLLTHGAEYLGALPVPERNEWMGRATALLCPTQYIEPFGSVVIEGNLCGTPAITTDFGAFTETVEEGVTGFRCRYLGEFVRALKMAGGLDRARIRERAVARYSIEAVAPLYEAYFARLGLLWEQGWNALAA